MGRPDGVLYAWNSGYTGKTGFDNETFTGRDWPDNKYYDLYTTNDKNTACNGSPCKGHALNEIAGWYGDVSDMANANNPWVIRGGYWYNGDRAGVFYFSFGYGHANSTSSFRIVLAP